MQIGQAGKKVGGGHLKQIFSWDVNLCLRVILKSVVVLSEGIPCVACTCALKRQSDSVEDRLGCCLTLSFSSRLSPICLGNHTPRCRGKGRVRGSEENPADRDSKIGRKKGTGEWTKHKEGDFSRRNGNSLALVTLDRKFALKTLETIFKCDIHFLP